jgi:hypothetical protein
MEYFVQINTTPIQYRSYTGLAEETISDLLNTEMQTSFVFIDKTTFDNALEALKDRQ